MKKWMLILSCLFLSVGFVIAQSTSISGTVFDTNGETVIGASVVVKGTTIGTATDIDGKFTINVPASRNTLVFSLIGLKTTELKAAQNMRVVMENDSELLDEIVVTGYGVTRKASFAGAASRIDSRVISARVDPNPIKALDGIVPGLQMNISSGQPGAPTDLFIRGRSSINSGTQPLYVIDGVPINADAVGVRKDEGSEISPLSTLSSSDIESITVLKDATATSIYGARAANGVVVITTKRGKAGRTAVNFTAKLGAETRPSMPSSYKLVNGDKYTEMYVESFLNEYAAYGDGSATAYYNDVYFGGAFEYTKEGMRDYLYAFSGAIEGTNTDWFKEVTRTGLYQEYVVDVQGGGDNPKASKYFLSFSYLGNDAFVRGKDLTRYSVRLNLDQAPSDFVKFGLNTNLSYTETNMGSGGGYYSDPITQAYMQSPLHPVKDENGNWFMDTDNGYNPVAQRSKLGDKNTAKQYRALISPFVQLYLPQDLIFQTKGGIDYYFLEEFGYWSFLQPQGNSMRGMGENTDSKRLYLSWTNTLNYLKTFNKTHNLNVLLGQEVQKTIVREAYLSASNYAVDYLTEVALASSPGTPFTTRNDMALASFFANAEYDYLNRYYLSGSFRYDGSSRFGSNNRWAPFWSVGAKYRIIEEKFMKEADLNWLDNLTFRASYGTSGNQEVGSQDFGNPRYASRFLVDFGYNYNNRPGSGILQLGNEDLKWEQTNKFNIGFDIALFKKLSIEFDYYHHKTSDMVFDVPISATTSLYSYLMNIGELTNKGFEVTVNSNIISNKDFSWNVSLTAAKNKNEVVKLSTNDPIEGNYSITEAGRPLYTFKMKEWAGVDPETGSPLWYLNETGAETTSDYSKASKRYVGDANPDLLGAFTNSFQYKNFDFTFQLNYSLGGKIYGNNLRYDEQIGGGAFGNFTEYVYKNRWQKPGDVTSVPKLMFLDGSSANAHSSRFLMDGDYLKIRSVAIGYTFPKSIINKAKLSTARVFANADNLYTFTRSSYRGFDPSGIAANGVQWWNYPLPRTIIFGVTLGF